MRIGFLLVVVGLALVVASCKSTHEASRDDVELNKTDETWFSDADTNDDGVIEKDEMRAVLGDDAENLQAWHQTYTQFVYWDTNDDRLLTRREYRDAMDFESNGSTRGPEPSLSDKDINDLTDSFFAACDKDGDDVLSKEELSAAMDSDEVDSFPGDGLTKEMFKKMIHTMMEMH